MRCSSCATVSASRKAIVCHRKMERHAVQLAFLWIHHTVVFVYYRYAPTAASLTSLRRRARRSKMAIRWHIRTFSVVCASLTRLTRLCTTTRHTQLIGQCCRVAEILGGLTFLALIVTKWLESTMSPATPELGALHGDFRPRYPHISKTTV